VGASALGGGGGAAVAGAAAAAGAAGSPNNVHRGPSNASSQYTASHSDVTDPAAIGVAYGSGIGASNPPPPPQPPSGPAPPYYEAYRPYDPSQAYVPQQAPSSVGGSPPIGGADGVRTDGAPVIRDNPARRNPARIESPSHYPQQGGISQNF
jgi:hypothetical protein